MSASKTMKAVVFDGPYSVSLQDRPIPHCETENLRPGIACKSVR